MEQISFWFIQLLKLTTNPMSFLTWAQYIQNGREGTNSWGTKSIQEDLSLVPKCPHFTNSPPTLNYVFLFKCSARQFPCIRKQRQILLEHQEWLFLLVFSLQLQGQWYFFVLVTPSIYSERMTLPFCFKVKTVRGFVPEKTFYWNCS